MIVFQQNLQSTNWQNVRWKPPPKDAKSERCFAVSLHSQSYHVSFCGVKDMGWRVELRTMEVQLTDFENAAFTVSCPSRCLS